MRLFVGRFSASRRSILRFSVAFLITGAALGQRPIPNFDIRQNNEVERRAGSAAIAEASDKRAGVASAYLAASEVPGLQTARLHSNRWHLPRLVANLDAPLTEPSDASPEQVARRFLKLHQELFLLNEHEVDALTLTANVPVAEASVLHLVQTVAGLEVLGGDVTVVVSGAGEVLRAGVDRIVPGGRLNAAFAATPEQAATSAQRSAGADSIDPGELRRVAFPSSPSTLLPAYEVYVEAEDSLFQIVVSGVDGALLLRRDLTRRMTQGRVYGQSPAQGPAELIDFPDEWLNGTTTNGAFVDAFRDADGDREPDSERVSNLRDGRAASRDGAFDFPFPAEGENPRDFAAAAITNAFAIANQAHDYFYALGFDEISGNLQRDNGGLGGRDGDPAIVRVHRPDVFFTPNALPRPDGTSGIINLSFGLGASLTDPNDDHDDAYSGMSIFHEYAHLMNERLVKGRSNCLVGTQSAAIDEGWADYFASSFYDDPVFGAYASGDDENGFRRSSLAASELTYGDLGNEGFEPHNDGEVWSATMWDIREALGQQVADQLIVDGMKMTPCDPSMIDARDAIIEADRVRNQGENRNALWEIFAARGMGFSAAGFDGFQFDTTMFTSAFDLPPGRGDNRLPTASSRPGNFVFLDEPWGYRINAIDLDGDALTYELLQGPDGLTLAPDGRLAWRASTFTEQLVRVAISDGQGTIVHAVTIPVVTVLEFNRPLAIDGPRFSRGVAAVLIRPDMTFQMTVRGGEGNADAILLGDAVYRSERAGNDETLTIVDPPPGFWFVYVDAFPEYSGAVLRFRSPSSRAFAPNVILDNISRPESSESYFRVDVPEGADSLTVSTGGGTGDVDLYMAFDRLPICQRSIVVDQQCFVDVESAGPGNYHYIKVEEGTTGTAKGEMRVEAPAPGAWFINLSAHRAIEDLTLNVTLDTGEGAPSISDGGVVNAASFADGLSPGAIGTLFGDGLVPINEEATTLPLPRQMQGLEILFGGVEAPLFFGSPGQVNFQVPSEAELGEALVLVRANGLRSVLAPGQVQLDAPGVFTYTSAAGMLEPVITHADGTLVTPESPARANEVLVIFFTGLSSVTNRPASGEAALASPLSTATIEPIVLVGEERAQVLFAGLTAGLVGLAQLNIQMPMTLPEGDRATMEVLIGTATSEPIELAIAQD